MFDDLKNIKSGRKELREFGLTIGIILVVLGGLVLWRGKREFSPYLLSVGVTFITLGLTFPGILKPLQKVWMGFSVVMGFFVSRIILSVLFFLVISPIGLIARLLGKDLLDQRIDKSVGSYWKDRDEVNKSKESYENQY